MLTMLRSLNKKKNLHTLNLFIIVNGYIIFVHVAGKIKKSQK